MKPQILTKPQKDKLLSDQPSVTVLDDIDLYIGELFDIEYPSKKDIKSKSELDDFKLKLTADDVDSWGAWVYLPWLNLCQHIPLKDDLRRLRTSRNRNLISAQEQLLLYSKTIFIAGMSVGSNVVEAMVSQGIGGKFVLADMDIIEPSNLNRIRSPLHHVGLHKIEAISRKVWEMDPYIDIIACNEGVNPDVVNQVLTENQIDIIVDEMDSLSMKVLLREVAKERSLPVVMAADDGDDALVDIERYDIHENLALFNGLIPEAVIDRIKQGPLPRKELGLMIGKYFVGPEHIPLRMFESLMEIGKTLPSWPQLGGAAALSGISIAYVSKKILIGEPVREGRILISLDEKLSPLNDDKKYQEKLQEYRKIIFN